MKELYQGVLWEPRERLVEEQEEMEDEGEETEEEKKKKTGRWKNYLMEFRIKWPSQAFLMQFSNFYLLLTYLQFLINYMFTYNPLFWYSAFPYQEGISNSMTS